MRRLLQWIALVALMIVATILLGWWTVPILGAVWGAAMAASRRVALTAAAAGATPRQGSARRSRPRRLEVGRNSARQHQSRAGDSIAFSARSLSSGWSWKSQPVFGKRRSWRQLAYGR